MLQMKKETANKWEYKVGNNANIVNFLGLWKTQMYSLIVDKVTLSLQPETGYPFERWMSWYYVL